MGFQVYNSQGQELQNLTGSAGGDLTGTFPNPTIATGAVTQAKIADKTPAKPTYETSLPASPADGQEIYYAADATNGVIWHLRYRSGSSSSYKWEFVGGPPLISQVATEQGTTSTSYTDLTTSGPSITLPLAGDYDISIGYRGYNSIANTQSIMSYAIGATAAADADGVDCYTYTEANGFIPNNFGIRRKTGLSAVTLTAKYKMGNASGTAYFQNRFIKIMPVRVG